jgi:hypothetical protein
MACIGLACRWIIFGPKGSGIRGGWRKLHNEELHNIHSLYCLIDPLTAKDIEEVSTAVAVK